MEISTTESASTGDLVRVRDAIWRVMHVQTFARVDVRLLRLVGADALNRWQPCTLLEPFDRPRRIAARDAPRVVSRARWMRTLAALLASSAPARGEGDARVDVWPSTVAQAQVTLMPHQIAPLMAVLRGEASRVLLADAVGLGKTIQAALILRELRARGLADRVLVLVPCGLRDQWQQELSHRTALASVIVDAASLAARARELPPDVNPWSLPGITIASVDFMKQPGVLRGADRLPWDILVVDEAHGLNEGTERLAAVDLLARRSRHVLLLTATPHHGSDDGFAALCRIGQTDDDHDRIAIFRRTRSAIGVPPRRRVHICRITPTREERWLHTLLARYAHRVEQECRRETEHDSASTRVEDAGASRDAAARAVSLAVSVLLKRASSSASSLERSLRRRLALLGLAEKDGASAGRSASVDAHAAVDAVRPERIAASGIAGGVTRVPVDAAAEGLRGSARHRRAVQASLPFDLGGDAASEAGDVDDADDADIDSVQMRALGMTGLRSRRVERAWLTLLIEAARNAARVESKPRALARWLARARGEAALIYTEYRDTLTHFASMLPRDVSCAVLHGGLGVEARRLALTRFLSGEARVLLTTDAAGEGLNLHHRCRLVFNVELPWNPNRLEQRIGRVDRLGQTRTVHAVHLVAAGTAEEQMLDRLTGRIQRIESSLGDAPRVLAAMPAASRAPSDSPLGAAVVHQLRLSRAAQARAWRAWARGRGRRSLKEDGEDGCGDTDPLLGLDVRAPLVAVCRGGRCHLASPGLLCIWRTRVLGPDGRGRPPLLTVLHLACDVAAIPRAVGRRRLLSFVSLLLDASRARIEAVLDREVERALRYRDDAERPWRERLARRDAAIADALHAHAEAGVQPLLFAEIAAAQTQGIALVTNDRCHRRRASTGVVDEDAADTTRRIERTLALVLVLR